MVDTIFAQASARVRAGVAVIRISGPRALSAGAALCGGLPAARVARLRWLRDPDTGEALDRGLVLAFPGPDSFTGEDVIELQVHGSVAVSRSLSAALGRMDGLREAEPGEFTRRALMNGRLDLSQVEGLGDLLAAETAAQQRQALAAMDGAVSRLVSAWRSDILKALAFVEATIDFADEELPGDVLEAVDRRLGDTLAAMESELGGSRMAERLRDGFEVALVGRPNVGKSTLLNALAGRDAALTSETAGTTRDVIEVRMDLGGLPLTLLDMAGLREPGEQVEALGIARARQRAERADLRVFLIEEPADLGELGVPRQDGDVVAVAKADLRADGCGVSGVTGAGIEDLLASIEAALRDRVAAAGSLAHARQRQGIERAHEALHAARHELAGGDARTELVAEDLRAALRAVDFLVGRVDVEAVLEVIFRNFCLGK